VILVDANLLIYAHVDTLPQHAAARTWLDDQLNGSTQVGLPWPSLLAFLRLVTNPRVFRPAEPAASAWRQVHEWLACETAWTPTPTARHADILGALVTRTSLNSGMVADAHLAALAIEHGLTLCSADADFARFHDLRWQNPVAEQVE
jgi:toxin-antitoxin system PIN domain toxin